MFVIQTFTCLIYFALKRDLSKISQIIIDKEYPGYESLIKNYLLQLIRQDLKNFPADRIGFTEIGRKSSAHHKAYRAYKRKRADKRIKAEQILRIIAKLK